MNRDSIVAYIRRKHRVCLILPYLREHLVYIRIGCDVKGDNQPHDPDVGVQGKHVIHVVHTAQLLLDGGGDRLFDR